MNGEGLLKFLKEYWFVIIFIGSLVMGWTTFQSRLSAVELRLTTVETATTANSQTIQLIQQNLASINTNLEFIKAKLNER